jgi:hypothetical protein
MPYVDSDAILGVGSDPVGFQPGLSDDFVHPNDLGSASLAAAALVLLSRNGVR